MTRSLVEYALVTALGLFPWQTGGAPKTIAEATPVTLTGTIEKIDKATRTVTVKGQSGHSIEINAPAAVQGFDTLKVGDKVSATYYEALAVQLRKPGDPPPPPDPIVTTQRKELTPGSETRRQQTFAVTVEAVDPKAPSIRVKGPQGRVVTLSVKDPKQLERVKPGDTIDVTYYEALMVKIAR